MWRDTTIIRRSTNVVEEERRLTNENAVTRCGAVDAVCGVSFSWFLLYVLRHLRGSPLVQHAVSVKSSPSPSRGATASLWFVSGTWMLFWWFDKPHGWDDFAPGAFTFIGAGVAGTIGRYFYRRQQTLQAVSETKAEINEAITPSQVVAQGPEIKVKVEVGRPKKRKKTIKLVEKSDGVWVPEGDEWND